MGKRFLLFFISYFLFLSVLQAREPVGDSDIIKKVLPPIQKFFVGSSLDGAIFSSGTIQNTTQSLGGLPQTSNTMATIRFSLVVNAGVTFNFNPFRHFGWYTGIDVKNVGFIMKDGAGETVKRRTYNVGAPVGIKLGNMARKGNYFFLGGGMDIPVEYKEKTYTVRSEKTKTNEWFSKRTPAVMPYVFAGLAVSRGATLKVQYYPNNYLNSDYNFQGYKPYSGLDVHLLLLSLGVNMRYGKHPDIVEGHVADLKTM